MTGAEVRGEAARLVARLEAAGRRLDEARAPRAHSELGSHSQLRSHSATHSHSQTRAIAASTQEISNADTAIARVCGGSGGESTATAIDNVDDEVRALLTPAANRVAGLLELARALADGTLSDESADEAARAIAASQPSRRPR